MENLIGSDVSNQTAKTAGMANGNFALRFIDSNRLRIGGERADMHALGRKVVFGGVVDPIFTVVEVINWKVLAAIDPAQEFLEWIGDNARHERFWPRDCGRCPLAGFIRSHVLKGHAAVDAYAEYCSVTLMTPDLKPVKWDIPLPAWCKIALHAVDRDKDGPLPSHKPVPYERLKAMQTAVALFAASNLDLRRIRPL